MPFHFEDAITKGDHETVRGYLQEPPGLQLDVRNKASETMMMIACRAGSDDAFDEMMEADVTEDLLDAVDASGSTALFTRFASAA